MNYASEAAAGLSPLALVVRLYDAVIADLGRAITAVRDGDIEKRSNQLNHALLIISYLQNALDMENGGKPAALLAKFYNLSRQRILEAQIRQSEKVLEEIINDFISIRDAWTEVEKRQSSAVSSEQVPPSAAGGAWVG